jgi:hypothetical protein
MQKLTKGLQAYINNQQQLSSYKKHFLFCQTCYVAESKNMQSASTDDSTVAVATISRPLANYKAPDTILSRLQPRKMMMHM